MDGNCGGMGLQLYPEPYADPDGPAAPLPLSITPAPYDGAITLATVETRRNERYGISGTPQRDLMLLARYDGDLDLEEDADGTGELALQPDTLSAPAYASLLDGTRPGTLHPDGVYSEAGRAPAYRDRDNANGLHGVFSLWVKPSYMRWHQADWHSRGRRYIQWTRYTVYQQDGLSADQFFGLTDSPGMDTPWGFHYQLQFEKSNDTSDETNEVAFYATGKRGPWGVPDHAWRLVTFLYDFQGDAPDLCGEIVADDGTGTDGVGSQSYYLGTLAGGIAADITQDEPRGPHLLVLGQRRLPSEVEVEQWLGGGADSTFDELAIWNFGGTPDFRRNPAALQQVPQFLAAERYQEGRYYRGADHRSVPLPGRARAGEAGSYFTAPMRLPAGSLIRDVRWTWMRPASLQQDFAEIELVTERGDGYLWAEAESRSTGGAPAFDPARQSWEIDRAPPGAFRIRAVFRRPPPADPGAPLLESPLLDDITLLYDPPSGAPFLSWADAGENR